MALPVRPYIVSALPPKLRRHTALKPVEMACQPCTSSSSSIPAPSVKRKLPILLFDVMDTLVRDPFYHDVPAFFRMSFKDLIEDKHPTAWLEFEHGIIDENSVSFADGALFSLVLLHLCFFLICYCCYDVMMAGSYNIKKVFDVYERIMQLKQSSGTCVEEHFVCFLDLWNSLVAYHRSHW